MKTRILKNLIGSIFTVVICLLIFSSCHQKGCTNQLALNYDATADQDDGSCIVCKTTQTQIDTTSVYLIDTYFQSPYYNQRVARFFLNQQVQTFSDKLCGKATSTISLTIQSLVSKNMYVYYNVRTFSGPVNVSAYNTIYVAPYETLDEKVIETFNNPPFIPMSLDSIYVQANNQIIYY